MREIANCMISGYDVLPSEPRDFRFSNVGTNIGILHWDLPSVAADTIESYKVTYTLIRPGGSESRNIKDVKYARKSPYILEDLEPDSSYEVYVQAKNFYGFGDPSTRIVFRTAKSRIQEKITIQNENTYNQQNCCERAGVTAECIPMCQYNASLSEVRKLTNLCKADLPRITKCAAGMLCS